MKKDKKPKVSTAIVIAPQDDIYGQLSPEDAAALEQATERIKQHIRNTFLSMVMVGDDLHDIKQRLGHGAYQNWLRNEFDLSERWANNAMSVARYFKGKTAQFAGLKPSVAVALASPSMSEEVRARVALRLEAGDSVTMQMVKEITLEVEIMERVLEDERNKKESTLAKLHEVQQGIEQRSQQMRETQEQRASIERKLLDAQLAEEDVTEADPSLVETRQELDQAIASIDRQLADIAAETATMEAEAEELQRLADETLSQKARLHAATQKLRTFKGKLAKLLMEDTCVQDLLNCEPPDDNLKEELLAIASDLASLADIAKQVAIQGSNADAQTCTALDVTAIPVAS